MDISTPKAVLIASKARIDTPEKWGKGFLINTDTGCLCALGAICLATNLVTEEELREVSDLDLGNDEISYRITEGLNQMAAVRLLAECAMEINRPQMPEIRGDDDDISTIVWDFNDNNSHTLLMEAFDAAIAKA